MRIVTLAALVSSIAAVGHQPEPHAEAASRKASEAYAGVTVVPTGSRTDFHADSTAQPSGAYQSFFLVTNTSGHQENFQFSCLSSTNISCQSAQPANFLLTAGNNVTVTVFWNSLSIGGSATQSANIRVVAEGDSNSFGQGTQNLTLWKKAPRVFVVTPIDSVLWPNPFSLDTNSVSFQVRNVGTTTETLDPTCNTSSSVECLSHSLTGITLVPFDPPKTDGVTFVTTQTATGQFLVNQIRPSGGAVADSGRYTFDVVRNPFVVVSVTPDGGPAVQRSPNTTQTIPFTVTNTGSKSAEYKLGVVSGGCSGPAFTTPTTCRVTSPASGLTGLLAPNGGSIPVTVSFDTRAIGNSGRITLRAQHVVDSAAIFDTGFSDVTIVPSPISVQVTPDGGTLSRVSETSTTVTFTVAHTQTAGAPPTTTYTINQRQCVGSSFPQNCQASPTTLNFSSSGSQTFDVTYSSSGVVGSSALVEYEARAQHDTAIANPGSITVTYQSAASRQVMVTALTASRTDTVNQSNKTLVFRVQNTGTIAATYNLSTVCTPVILASCATPPTTNNLTPGGFQNITVTYATGSSAGSGSVGLRATDTQDAGVTHTASTALTVVTGGPSAIALRTTPDNEPRNTAGARPDTAVFTVKNVGTGGGTVSFTAACPSPLFTATCTPHIASVSIQPNESTFVRVPLTTAAFGTGPDTGTVSLTATSGSVSDPGSIKLTRVNAQALIASADSTHAGVTVARDVCLMLALPSDATSECGHLRLWHPLPTTRTMTTLRVPTMIYSSAHAHPYPTVPIDVTLPSGAAKPDSVELRTRVNGTIERTARYLGSDLQAGIGRRVVAGYDASTDSTGIYNYSLELTSFYGTSRLDATPLTGQLAVVNRDASAYGAGWWLAGLEQLIVQPDSSRLWIGGDGSTRRYAKIATNTYVAPALDFPDTLRWDPANSRYERRERGGVRVRYNTQGNHTSTLNRLGHTTTFTYVATGSNPRLDRLTIPVPAGAATQEYVFTYSSNKLTSIGAPPIGGVARPTAFTISTSNQLQSITDPDTSVVQFGFDATFFRRVVSRTDRRNVVTTFAFDSAHNISLGRLTMESGKPPIPVSIRSLAIQGFGALPGAVNRMADTSLVYVMHDGPRPISDVGDTTRFYLDRYGAAKRIADALGNTTRLTRADTRFPTLVTSLQRANGHVLNATYDVRGNLSLSIDVGGNSAGVPDTARYVWDQTWDILQRVVPQMKDSIVFGIDPANGNRLSQKFVAAAQLFNFTYYAGTGLIATTKSPAVSKADSIFYDAQLGNLSRTKTPKGYVSEWFRDGIGRDTLSTTPIDTTASPRRVSTRTVYDIVSQVRTTQTSAPATSYTLVSAPASTRPVPAETVTVIRTYDREGNLRTIQTLPSGDSVDVLPSEFFSYDNAGRVLTRNRSSGPIALTYDEAGNPIVQRYRGGADVTETYDALNRRIQRIVPGALFPTQGCTGFPPGPLSSGSFCLMQFPFYPNDPQGLRIPAEISTFAYDAVGNLTLADNADAHVRRGYTLNGQVSHDTLAIRSYATSSFTATVFVTTYGYDRNGRRRWMRVPSQIALGDSMDFTYDGSGLARIVRDPSGRRHQLGYDSGRRPTSYEAGLASGGLPILEQYVYDDDDRLIRRTRTATGIPGFVSADTLAYDARGKILTVRRLTRVQNVGTEHVDLVYSGLGAIVAMDRRFNVNQWQIEENRADAIGHVWWSQTKSFANGPQLEQRSQLRLQTGALMSRAAAFPQSPTGSTLYPDEVSTGIPTSGAVARTSEVQQNFITKNFVHYAATRTYTTVDGKTHVVQRYQVNDTISNGAYEEYRYDALGRRVLMRTRKTTTPPAGGGTLAALCSIGPCASSISRWIWDGAQLLGEIRAPGQDGLNSGQLDQLFGSPPHYGVVGYVHHHAGGWDEPKGLMDGRVLNPNWRGLPESSQLVDGTAPDCSMGLNPGTCITVAWPTDVGPYFRRPVPAAQGSIVPTWLGTLPANGATGSGRLYRRFREYDPATGQFTHEDPIGLAGGANLYGFANGDPVNFSDPFGLCPPADNNPYDCPGYLGAFVLLGQASSAMQRELLLFLPRNVASIATGGALGGAARAAITITARGTMSTVAQSAAIGRAGEAAAQIARNTTRIPSVTGTAAYRVPDALTATTLTEVKNVARLSLTAQIRDMAAYAEQTGRVFELVVRRSTEFTAPLATFIREHGIRVRYLP